MSQLTKHSEARVIWTIGNTQIVESEPDQGITPTLKAAALGIAAITAAPISPVIAIALAGYAAMKVFESFQFAGKDGADMAKSIYDDVNGTTDAAAETVPPGWVPMPQLPGEPRYQPSPQTQLGAIDVPVEAAPTGNDPVSVLNRAYQQSDPIGLPSALRAVATSKPYSTLICGMSGAGKDITLYNIMRSLKTAHPNHYFLGIDAKGFEEEKPLWSFYDYAFHINAFIDPIEYHALLVEKLEYAAQRRNVFVAFSEINGLKSTYLGRGRADEWKQIAFLIGNIATQGNSFNRFLYGTVQGISLESLGIANEERGNLHFLAIANVTQFGYVQSVLAEVKVFPKTILDSDRFNAAISHSTATQHLKSHDIVKGVAYFHSAIKRWEPMPRLENPGHDRDNPLPQSVETNAPRSAPVVPIDSEGSDPAIELIQDEPNAEKREALLIAYRWAKTRLDNDKEVSREIFLNRAKNDRKSLYLQEQREEVWEDLQALIN